MPNVMRDSLGHAAFSQLLLDAKLTPNQLGHWIPYYRTSRNASVDMDDVKNMQPWIKSFLPALLKIAPTLHICKGTVVKGFMAVAAELGVSRRYRQQRCQENAAFLLRFLTNVRWQARQKRTGGDFLEALGLSMDDFKGLQTAMQRESGGTTPALSDGMSGSEVWASPARTSPSPAISTSLARQTTPSRSATPTTALGCSDTVASMLMDDFSGFGPSDDEEHEPWKGAWQESWHPQADWQGPAHKAPQEAWAWAHGQPQEDWQEPAREAPQGDEGLLPDEASVDGGEGLQQLVADLRVPATPPGNASAFEDEPPPRKKRCKPETADKPEKETLETKDNPETNSKQEAPEADLHSVHKRTQPVPEADLQSVYKRAGDASAFEDEPPPPIKRKRCKPEMADMKRKKFQAGEAAPPPVAEVPVPDAEAEAAAPKAKAEAKAEAKAKAKTKAKAKANKGEAQAEAAAEAPMKAKAKANKVQAEAEANPPPPKKQKRCKPETADKPEKEAKGNPKAKAKAKAEAEAEPEAPKAEAEADSPTKTKYTVVLYRSRGCAAVRERERHGRQIMQAFRRLL